MSLRASCAALLLSNVLIAGCGTVTNLVHLPPPEGGKTPFGGVRQDMAGIHKAANGECACRSGNGPNSEHAQVAPMLFYAADLPFSLLGDVIAWPYPAAYTFINEPIPVPPVTQA